MAPFKKIILSLHDAKVRSYISMRLGNAPHIVPLKQILPNSFFGCFELGIISESKLKGASTCGIAEVKRYLQIV